VRSAILLVALGLSACAAQQPSWQPPRITDTACNWVRPMTFSADDTPQTKEEIIAYEMARRRNCPRAGAF